MFHSFESLPPTEESGAHGNVQKTSKQCLELKKTLVPLLTLSPRDVFHETKLKFPFYFWKHLREPCPPQLLKTKQRRDQLEKSSIYKIEDKGWNVPVRCLKQNSHCKEPESLQQVCKYQHCHPLKEQVPPISNFPPPIMERSRRTRLTYCHPLVHGRTSQALE